MGRGRRYEEQKLNLKKVFAVLIAIAVVIMFIFVIKGFFTQDKKDEKITSESYFSVFNNNKWGVINSKGEYVIDSSYQEMIIVPNSKSDVFLCTYDVNYTTGSYNTKALNSKNQEILTGYESIEAISNYDKSNNVWYESNILKVKKDGKYGIINLTGKEILECKYEEISSVQNIKNTLKVKLNGKYGAVDSDGKKLIDTQYMDIENLGKESKEGFIVKAEDGKYGVVDYTGAKVLETKYDSIEKTHANDLYVATEGTKQELVKKGDTVVLADGFDTISSVLKSTTNPGIIFIENNQYGIMNQAGEVIVNSEYQDLKEAKSGIFIAKKDGKYGVIDSSNVTKVEFKYDSIQYNEKADLYIADDENLNSDIINNEFSVKQSGIFMDIDDEKGYIELRQGDDYKFYNFKFEEKNIIEILTSNTLFLSKKDGKYGFIDKNNNVVVDYKYDDATQQNTCGYAGIKKDGKWGVIDNKGNVITEPTYNLDNYLKVDFIGKWHLGMDVNMNYYNQQ